MSPRIPQLVVALLAAVLLALPVGPVATALSSTPSAGIAAGARHSCALTSGGGVRCWGYGGLLGNGSGDASLTPVDVVGLTSGVTAVAAAGGYHACALTSGGGVKCWGLGTYGELGNGSTASSSTPVDVIGLTSGVTAIAAGPYHSCALTSGGGVKCWGYGSGGQLGDGSTASSSTPVDVIGLTSGATAVAAGGYYGASCAVTSGGGVKCWGNNSDGLLGNGSSGGSSLTPVDVFGLASGVTAIAVGGFHACALTGVGGVSCWGLGTYGELGDGLTVSSSTPVGVTGLASGVSVIAAGDRHTCAVTSGGGVKCWGYNYSGELGNGSTTDSGTPVDVAGLASGATAVAAGYSHTCALLGTGGVRCWGYNKYGELGNGSTAGSSTPVAVPFFGPPTAPLGVTATAGNASAQVSWSAPASGGGSAITGYTVTSVPGGQTCTPTPATGTTCTVTGLANNSAYTFTVTAANGDGPGEASDPSATVAPTTGILSAAIARTTVGRAATSTIPVTIAFSTGLDAVGVVSYTLQRQANGGAWTAVALAAPTARSAIVAEAPGTRYAYRVRATTSGGALGAWVGGSTLRVRARQDGETTVRLTGTGWTRTTTGSPYGGTLRYTSLAGRTAKTTFTGTGIAWVSTLGRNRGRAEVWLDGRRVATISLYRTTTQARRIVWSGGFATSGTHTVVIKVLGRHASGATGNRVDLDAFLVLGP